MDNNLVLDVCCGSRMFWFNKQDKRAVYIDKRIDTWDIDGRKPIVVKPNIQADFVNLPFSNNLFNLVVFDPPHIKRDNMTGFIVKKYGNLTENWQLTLYDGFRECFRVLKPHGTLIFKWSNISYPVSSILALVDEKPLFGHISGKQSKTHWIAFIKS